jgi:hypothetical protein
MQLGRVVDGLSNGRAIIREESNLFLSLTILEFRAEKEGRRGIAVEDS